MTIGVVKCRHARLFALLKNIQFCKDFLALPNIFIDEKKNNMQVWKQHFKYFLPDNRTMGCYITVKTELHCMIKKMLESQNVLFRHSQLFFADQERDFSATKHTKYNLRHEILSAICKYICNFGAPKFDTKCCNFDCCFTGVV